MLLQPRGSDPPIGTSEGRRRFLGRCPGAEAEWQHLCFFDVVDFVSARESRITTTDSATGLMQLSLDAVRLVPGLVYLPGPLRSNPARGGSQCTPVIGAGARRDHVVYCVSPAAGEPVCSSHLRTEPSPRNA
jgi:hypothetical protein